MRPYDFMEANMLLKMKFAYTGNYIEYIGWAQPGVVESDPEWLIAKLIYNGSNFATDWLIADGSTNFDKAWSLRATYEYS
jgi:hypothetical protein